MAKWAKSQVMAEQILNNTPLIVLHPLPMLTVMSWAQYGSRVVLVHFFPQRKSNTSPCIVYSLIDGELSVFLRTIRMQDHWTILQSWWRGQCHTCLQGVSVVSVCERKQTNKPKKKHITLKALDCAKLSITEAVTEICSTSAYHKDTGQQNVL